MAAPSSSFASHVAERIAEVCPLRLHRYLVVDLAAIHGHPDVGDFRRLGEAVDLLHLKRVDWDNSASPALIDITSAGKAQMDRWHHLGERWRFANAITYFEHAESIAPFSTSLAQRTRALLEDGMEVVLRWFDNRALDVMLRGFTEVNRHKLVGDMVGLAYANRSGELRRADIQYTNDHMNRRIRLDQAEERALVGAAEPDGIIDLLLQQSQPNLVAMLPPNQHDLVAALLHRAKEYGIDQTADQVAFCSLGLELGPGFVDQLPWSNILRTAREQAGRLTDVLLSAKSGAS